MSLLIPGSIGFSHAQIKALVIYNICDAFIRSEGNQEYIVGILLGNIVNGVVNVNNCYPVLHTEQDGEITRNLLHQHYLVSQHRRIFNQDYFVGWFSFGKEYDGINMIFQNYHFQECFAPIYITLDTALFTFDKSIFRVYVSKVISLGATILGTELLEIPNEIDIDSFNKDIEKIPLHDSRLMSNSDDGMDDALHRLRTHIYAALQYLRTFKVCKQQCNHEVAREITAAIASVVEVFMKNKANKDSSNAYIENLAVIYIAKLMKTQMKIAEFLGTLHCPINIVG